MNGRLIRLLPDQVQAAYDLLALIGADLRERHGLDHWCPPAPLASFATQALTKAVYLIEQDQMPVATVTIGDMGWSEAATLTWRRARRPRYVSRFGIHPARQGQGLGRALMTWIERESAAHGYDLLRLDAIANDPAPNAFYTRLGYRAAGSVDWTNWYGRSYRLNAYDQQLG